ncbi:MAG: hypothetical protein HY549_03845 [Elusimicrobia bacterium]|nr:hypothetical protein [Elusimicrobiota bacterium]
MDAWRSLALILALVSTTAAAGSRVTPASIISGKLIAGLKPEYSPRPSLKKLAALDPSHHSGAVLLRLFGAYHERIMLASPDIPPLEQFELAAQRVKDDVRRAEQATIERYNQGLAGRDKQGYIEATVLLGLFGPLLDDAGGMRDLQTRTLARGDLLDKADDAELESKMLDYAPKVLGPGLGNNLEALEGVIQSDRRERLRRHLALLAESERFDRDYGPAAKERQNARFWEASGRAFARLEGDAKREIADPGPYLHPIVVGALSRVFQERNRDLFITVEKARSQNVDYLALDDDQTYKQFADTARRIEMFARPSPELRAAQAASERLSGTSQERVLKESLAEAINFHVLALEQAMVMGLGEEVALAILDGSHGLPSLVAIEDQVRRIRIFDNTPNEERPLKPNRKVELVGLLSASGLALLLLRARLAKGPAGGLLENLGRLRSMLGQALGSASK